MPQGTIGDVAAVRRRTLRVLFASETFNFAEMARTIEVTHRMPSHVECVFAGFSPRNTEYIRAADFEFRLLTPYLDEEEGRLALDSDQGRSLRHPFTEKMLAWRVTSERALLHFLRPDAVVIGVTPSQLISAQAEHMPLVFVRPFTYSLTHLKAAHAAEATDLLPRTSPEECLVDNVAAHALHALGTQLPLPRSFHSAAKADDVSPPQGVLDGLITNLNLIVTAPHLLPGWPGIPQGHRVAGPVYAHLPGEPPEFLADLAASPQPLVYFAMGPSRNRDFVLHILTGPGRTDCQVLAPVRSHLRQGDLENLPHSVHVTDWLPTHQLGNAVDLAATHGGGRTIQTSCVQGWPFVGILLQFEQHFNMQRCAAFGSARLMSQWETRRIDRTELVCQTLADDGMRSRVRWMVELIEEFDGPGRAAEAICELL